MPNEPILREKARQAAREEEKPAMPSRPTHDEIAECAYFRWLQRGCPIGSPDVDWAAAEAESLARHAPPDAGVSPPVAE
jgi:hypothetical protein